MVLGTATTEIAMKTIICLANRANSEMAVVVVVAVAVAVVVAVAVALAVVVVLANLHTASCDNFFQLLADGCDDQFL